MIYLRYGFIAGLCYVISSASLANGSTSSCVPYSGLDGKGETTAVEVIQPLPPLGEQLGEFEAILIRADCSNCKRHGKKSSFKNIIRWQGVVRGRQTEEYGMHHALANTNGYGYILTTDSADPVPLGECDVYGVPGLLVSETLEVDEGVWDGQIVSGRFVVNVCLPLDLHEGSKIQFKVADGTEICLTPEDEPD